MITATYNCGCPVKPSLIPKPIELQAPCSPCCFQLDRRLDRTLHHSQIRASQCYPQFETIKKPRHIYPTFESEVCCCVNHAFRTYSTPSRRPISAAVISKESVSKQFPRSRSESKLNIEMSNTEQTPTDKVVSEIVRKKQPYKEIEAIINDNRVIIRTQKEPVKEEYDPPCECIGQVASKESASSSRIKCDDGVTFDMADGNLKFCHTPREDTPGIKKTCEEIGCRTVTLYPRVIDEATSERATYPSRQTKSSRMERTIDLEENPNIFLLRIRKHCDSGDKRQKIDLEFRTPRPWLSRNGKKKDLLESERLEKHEDDTNEKHKDTDKI